MTSGEIVLTYSARCSVCRGQVPLGTRVWWDAVTSDITCLGNHIGEGTAAPTRPALYDEERSVHADPRGSFGAQGVVHPSAPTAPVSPSIPVDPALGGEPRTAGWNALDVSSPDWWDSFDYGQPARAVSPEPVYRPPQRPEPRPVAAPTPTPSLQRADDRDGPSRSVVPGWGAPIASARQQRHRSSARTVSGPEGIAGLSAAHRRTRLVRPPSVAWDPSTSLNLGIGRPVFVLDSRTAQGFDRSIDHVIVSQSGAFVLTVKQSRGLVEKRPGGTIAHPRDRLLVDGRERTRALRSALVRTEAVARVIAQMGNGWEKVPVVPVLCFVGAEWRPFAQPFEVDGVAVVWPKQVGSLVLGEAIIAPRSAEALAMHLDTRLPRA